MIIVYEQIHNGQTSFTYRVFIMLMSDYVVLNY